jgi:hypothetical protein
MSYVSAVICQGSYASLYVLNTMSKLLQVYSYISLYAYLSTSLCMLSVKTRMSATVYLHLYAGT